MSMKPKVRMEFVETPYFSKKERRPRKDPVEEGLRKQSFDKKMREFLDRVKEIGDSFIAEDYPHVEMVIQDDFWVLRSTKIDVEEAKTGLRALIDGKLKNAMGADSDGPPQELKDIIERLGARPLGNVPGVGYVAVASGGDLMKSIEAQAPHRTEEFGKFVVHLKMTYDRQLPPHDAAKAAKDTVLSWVKGKSVDTIKKMREALQKECELHAKECEISMANQKCELESMFKESISMLTEQEQVNLQ